MQLKVINPWTWQDALHFAQAVDAERPNRVLFLAGQTSCDANGRPMHAGDMAAQLRQAFDNLETVLAASDMSLGNLVRLNYYVTDMPAFHAARSVVADRLGGLDVKPSGCLLGVTCLAQPGLLVEIEATAAD